jgi:hypothetical protein
MSTYDNTWAATVSEADWKSTVMAHANANLDQVMGIGQGPSADLEAQVSAIFALHAEREAARAASSQSK